MVHREGRRRRIIRYLNVIPNKAYHRHHPLSITSAASGAPPAAAAAECLITKKGRDAQQQQLG